ncbi:LysR family transcriptional regulator [Oceanicoccus sp. KOV_DT_Chl]|uniref:LysR family transcriptional regulator n=1 Tax=Oceanicoccus sp. KOV_DT_Chl TaxID=1904639 RepID=UPI000C7B4AEA|nr:LysR family transcriptional regulator [Oceanicoccus sp. KOV_DT_Chl]
MNNLNELIVFAKVVDCGSFSEAAIQLGMTKSSVSKKIALLEKSLGAKLLQRTTRKIGITELGKDIYQHSAKIIAELDAVSLAVADAQHRPKGSLKVSASRLFGRMKIAPILPEFLNRYPEIDIALHLNEKTVDLIGDGYDIALCAGELEDSSLIAQPLYQVNIVTCASPMYLSQQGVPTSPSQLEQHNYLLWQQGENAPPKQLRLEKGGRVEWPVITSNFISNDIYAIREAAIANGGITMLPDFSVETAIKKRELESILRDYHISQYPISILYADRKQMPEKLKVFINYLKEKLQYK